jgi:predicted ATPase
LVRLEAVDTTASLHRVLAETLHVPDGGRALEERLSGAETLLVLDNCEHVVENAGELVGSLLGSVPDLRGQAPLGIEDERLYPLEPLSPGQSIELFSRRAREIRDQFVLDAPTRAHVAGVCRALDGLPLAIELAAARVRSLSVPDIARRLDHRFALLQDPSSHRSERRRALAGAIRWSYDLLFPDDQRGLWATACFAGDASLDALERVLMAVGVPAGAVVDTMTRLVDRSLVSLDVAADGRARYRLLDSIRDFADDRIEESGLRETALAAHAGWYAEVAAWCEASVRTARQRDCLAVARAERANIDAALAWCRRHDPELGARIATGFGWTWVVLGDGTTGAARVRDAVSASTSPAHRARGLLVAGWLEASAGNLALAQDDLDAADLVAAEFRDDLLLADTARLRAFLAIQQGRADVVLASTAASLATYRAHGLEWEVAASTLLGAFGALMLGDTDTADRDAARAVAALTGLGDAWALVHAQALVGGVAQAEHRFADAAEALQRAAERARTLGFPGQAALHLASLARVQQRTGQDLLAERTFAQAISDATAGGDGRLAATARLHLARLLRKEGRGTTARGLLEENRRWYDRAGGGDGALLTRCALSAENGDRRALQGILAEAVAGGDVEVRVHALDALARAVAEEDRPRARALLAEADALQPTVAFAVDDADRVDRSAALGILAARL